MRQNADIRDLAHQYVPREKAGTLEELGAMLYGLDAALGIGEASFGAKSPLLRETQQGLSSGAARRAAATTRWVPWAPLVPLTLRTARAAAA